MAPSPSLLPAAPQRWLSYGLSVTVIGLCTVSLAFLAHDFAGQQQRWGHLGGLFVVIACSLGLIAVTRRLHHSQKRLATTYDRYRDLVEHLPIMIYIDKPDLQASNLYTSPYSVTVCGYSPEDWQSAELFESIVHPDDREQVSDDHRRMLEGGDVLSTIYRIKAKDGGWRWVKDEAILIRDTSGKALHVQGCWQDVTAAKDLEVQLMQSQKMEAVGQLAGGIAHDFNNILQAIGGYAELAEIDAITPELEESVSEIRQATRRAATLTKQLLSFSRQDVRQPELLDVRDVVCDIDDMIRRLIGEHIEINVELSELLPAVEADRSQLEQILVNLAVNARDALEDGGQLEIRVSSQEDATGRWVVLAVNDNGCGMDEETKSHLFEPFYTTKEVGHGTGIGLSTVYGIVEQSSGRIEVESIAGQGSLFSVFLPALGAAVPRREDTPTRV